MKLIAVVDQILDEEIKVHLDLLSVTILAKWILERWQRLDIMSQHFSHVVVTFDCEHSLSLQKVHSLRMFFLGARPVGYA